MKTGVSRNLPRALSRLRVSAVLSFGFRALRFRVLGFWDFVGFRV